MPLIPPSASSFCECFGDIFSYNHLCVPAHMAKHTHVHAHTYTHILTGPWSTENRVWCLYYYYLTTWFLEMALFTITPLNWPFSHLWSFCLFNLENINCSLIRAFYFCIPSFIEEIFTNWSLYDQALLYS